MNNEHIICGKDFQEWSKINFPSLGALIIDRLKSENCDEKNFVSKFIKNVT